jgi:hypothetical protein
VWASRPDLFAAVAPSAAAGARNMKDGKPCPLLHLAGEKDALVKFEWQQRAVAAVRTFNGCEEQGKDWDKGCTIYASSKDAPNASGAAMALSIATSNSSGAGEPSTAGILTREAGLRPRLSKETRSGYTGIVGVSSRHCGRWPSCTILRKR